MLVGWTIHSAFLIQIAPHLAPMQRNTALNFVWSGLAILGIVTRRRTLVLVCSGTLGVIAGLSLLEYLLHVDFWIDQFLGADYVNKLVSAPGRMSPLTAICFTTLAATCALSHTRLLRQRAAVLGISGLLVIAAGVTCWITALSGVSDTFTWGNLTRMAVHTAVGFVVLGIGVTALAWQLSRPAVREPWWVSVGVGVSVATIRMGLWQTFAVRDHGGLDFLFIFTWLLALASAVWAATFVHLLLKASFQRQALRNVNRRLEREIAERRDAEQAAEAANRAKSDFLANMSHEIRTPMTGILGMIDLVRTSELSPQQQEHLDMAKSSAKSLLTLLNEILDLSKIEAGRFDLTPIPFSIRQCAADALRMFEIRAREKGLDLKAKVDNSVPDILIGDPLRLRQVLLNLVGNAVKFTAQGSISLVVGLENQTSSESVVLVQVADTGIGIPAEKHAVIFDAFRQSDESTTRRYGGTGLGLTISARLVELMGGRIRVESEPGKGSTFSFVIRFGRVSSADGLEALQAAAAPWPEPAPVASPKNSLRILVAEDNVVNQKLVAELLKREGHEIVVVGNGREAALAVERSAFDVVLMDVQMPDMDGFEATAAIRRLEKDAAHHTPIVAMTSHAMQGDQQKCIQAGMDDYLSKPISVQDLRAMVEKWAAGGSLSQRQAV
ncbi:MAG TPA: ATP-binding protein [Bryobacteraceae bacterium]|nr:ATP-binding protein [Bryobacteraceae bacterium]